MDKLIGKQIEFQMAYSDGTHGMLRAHVKEVSPLGFIQVHQVRTKGENGHWPAAADNRPFWFNLKYITTIIDNSAE